MNKKPPRSLEKSYISCSIVTLLISNEKTNIPLSGKVGSEIIGGSPRIRAVLKDAAITLITSQRWMEMK